jgi:hypothetical protein
MEKKNGLYQFRDFMTKANSDMNGWLIIWLSGLVIGLWVNRARTNSTGEDVFGIYSCLVLLLILTAAKAYADKYTKLYVSDVSPEEAMVFANTRVTDIVKSHSFDMAAYYGWIVKGFAPVQIVSAIAALIVGAAGALPMQIVVVDCAMFLLVPELVFLVKYASAAYRNTHSAAALAWILSGAADRILGFVRIFAVAVAFIMIAASVMSEISAHTLMAGIDPSEVVRFSSHADVPMIAGMFVIVVFSEIFSDTDRESNAALVGNWRKKRKYVIAGLLALIVVIGGIFTYVNNCENVKLTEDTITVRSHGESREYTLDDISGYEVYGSDGLQMNVTFADGTVTNIFRSAADDTPAWRERYYSDYNYAAELAEKLADRGVCGTIGNVNGLENYVKGLDRQCIEGYDKLMKIITNG